MTEDSDLLKHVFKIFCESKESDHCIKIPTWAIGKKKPEKNQGLNRIQTRDLHDTGAVLYQLSYEPRHWERGQIIGHSRILGIGLELAYKRGSCGGISLKSDECHLHLKRLPALASVSS